jgi:hypothetical protein
MRVGINITLAAAVLALAFYGLEQGTKALILFANYRSIAYMETAALWGSLFRNELRNLEPDLAFENPDGAGRKFARKKENGSTHRGNSMALTGLELLDIRRL